MSYNFTNGELSGTFGTGFGYPFTLAAWVKLPVTGQTNDFQTFLVWGVDNTSDDNQARLSMGNSADEVFRIVTQSGTGNTNTDWPFVDGTYDDVWVPIVATCGSGVQTIYVGSYAGGQTGSTRTITGTPKELIIGRRGPADNPWVGKIAEVAVSSSVWNQEQIEAYMAGARVPGIDASASYYSLELDDDTPSDEGVGSGPTLALSGTADWDADHPDIGYGSDAQSVTATAESPISVITTQNLELGVISAEETISVRKDFSSVDGDTSSLSVTETGSVFTNFLYKSSSDSQAITSDSLQNVEASGSIILQVSDYPNHITAVDTWSALDKLGSVFVKSADDFGSISDNRNINYVAQSSRILGPRWTSSKLDIATDVRDGPEGTRIADSFDAVYSGGTSCHITQDLVIELSSAPHCLYARVWISPTAPEAALWIAAENLGLDIIGYFPWEVNTNGEVVFSVGALGSNVSSAGVIELEDNYHLIYIGFNSPPSDIFATVKLGISDASGSKTVAPYSGLVKRAYTAGMQLNKGLSPTNYIDNTGIQWAAVDYDSGFLSRINTYQSSSDSPVVGLSSSESWRLLRTGTFNFFSTDSVELSSEELGGRQLYRSAIDAGSFTGVESASYLVLYYDPDWEADDTPWGGVLLGSRGFAPVYAKDDSFFALGLGFDKTLACSMERKGLVFEQGWSLLGRAIFPQVSGPSGSKVYISLGGQSDLDGEVDWEGPYDFVIGEDVSVDFAVAGRYLAVKFESEETGVWKLPSYTVDYEVTGVY